MSDTTVPTEPTPADPTPVPSEPTPVPTEPVPDPAPEPTPEPVHSEKFEAIKGYYIKKFWSERMVRNAVVKNWITAEEFTEITGKEY